MTATQMSQDGSNTVLIAAVTSVIVVVIIVLVILIYFLRVRKQRIRQQPSRLQESIGGQELVSNGKKHTWGYICYNNFIHVFCFLQK